ncbi:MAG TPA: type II secretion system F family protein [Acidobacteriaceae bacterium]|nr:type II secretion system F family protein [Acidobacteriaceae bacterium]
MELVQSKRPDERTVGAKERVQEKILTMAKGMRARLGLAEDEEVKQQLLGAGVRSNKGMNAYFASRIFGPLLGLVCGSLIHTNTIFWALSLAAVFYLVPDMWLKMRGKKRRERIRKSLPDALDLLVICVEAGLGLDQAMLRVGQELIISHPDIHQELMQINLEQLAGKPRLEAWKSAAERTQIPEFALFVSMLTQADRFGTPIVRALSRFGDEIRMKRRQRAEEMAAKTKIKILFPLVLFIFPCIFIVLLAPAILNIAKNMQSFK